MDTHENKIIPLDLLTLCASYGTTFIFMSVQKVGEILIWKKSNFLDDAFLLASSILQTRISHHNKDFRQPRGRLHVISRR